VTSRRRRTNRDVTDYLARPTGPRPARLDLEEITDQILVLHDAGGGATFNPHFGNVSGKALYAVSIFPERTIRLPRRGIPRGALSQFILVNQALLADPRLSIGTWYDAESDLTYIDIVATLPDREQALRLGVEYNQRAIYDLLEGTEIATGGDGSPKPGMSPPAERLPPLRAHSTRRKRGP
jgi:hypothetical protein